MQKASWGQTSKDFWIAIFCELQYVKKNAESGLVDFEKVLEGVAQASASFDLSLRLFQLT